MTSIAITHVECTTDIYEALTCSWSKPVHQMNKTRKRYDLKTKEKRQTSISYSICGGFYSVAKNQPALLSWLYTSFQIG